MAANFRTTLQIIERALRDLGIGAAGEPLESEDIMTGLYCFNDLIDTLKSYNLTIWRTARELFNMVGGQASYTIGPGGDWDTQRPTNSDLFKAGFVNTYVNPTQPLETPVHIYSDEEWRSISLKTMTNTMAWGIWLDSDMNAGSTPGLANIFVYPILDVTGQMALYLRKALEEVAEDETGLSEQILVPPGYRRMLSTNLALECADEFGVTPSANLVQRAQRSMDFVTRSNAKKSTLKIPPGVNVSSNRRNYNILTNQSNS